MLRGTLHRGFIGQKIGMHRHVVRIEQFPENFKNQNIRQKALDISIKLKIILNFPYLPARNHDICCTVDYSLTTIPLIESFTTSALMNHRPPDDIVVLSAKTGVNTMVIHKMRLIYSGYPVENPRQTQEMHRTWLKSLQSARSSVVTRLQVGRFISRGINNPGGPAGWNYFERQFADGTIFRLENSVVP